MILAAVWLLVRRATDSERVAHLASVLYLLTNWVGQNYFAAQTLATLLSLSVLGLVASWFFGAPPAISVHVGAAPRAGPAAHDVFATGVRRAIVLLLFLGLMMTHPLTPVATLGAVTLAWVIGWVRDRWIVGGIYLVVCSGGRCGRISYFAAQSFDLGFGGSPTENADGNLDYSAAPDAVVAVGNITRLFSVGGLGARHRRRAPVCLGDATHRHAPRRRGDPVRHPARAVVRRRGDLPRLPLLPAADGGDSSPGGSSRVHLIARGIGPATDDPRRRWCASPRRRLPRRPLRRERINNVEPSEVAMGDYIAVTLAGPGRPRPVRRHLSGREQRPVPVVPGQRHVRALHRRDGRRRRRRAHRRKPNSTRSPTTCSASTPARPTSSSVRG